MYSLPKGNANKLLVKTRRGISQKLDINSSPDRKSDLSTVSASTEPHPSSSSSLSSTVSTPVSPPSYSPSLISCPKPVFLMSGRRNLQGQKSHKDTTTPQHKELVQFLQQSWTCVKNEVEVGGSVGGVTACIKQSTASAANKGLVASKSSSSIARDFEPFDLEAFWGQRLFRNLTS